MVIIHVYLPHGIFRTTFTCIVSGYSYEMYHGHFSSMVYAILQMGKLRHRGVGYLSGHTVKILRAHCIFPLKL